MADAPRPSPENGGEVIRPHLVSCKASREADQPIESVGQDLCKARQRKAKQLSDIWLVLKIRPDYLIAIEEGRFEALPGPVYAIGYVRSYAAYLGLDAGKFVDRLKTEMAARNGAWNPAIDVSPVTERRVPQGAVMAGLLLVAFIYSSYYLLGSTARTAEPPVMPVPARLAAEAGLTSKALADLPRDPPERPSPAVPREPLLPLPMEIVVTPPAAIPIQLAPKIQTPLPAGKRYGTRNRNSRITLRVHRATRVAVQGNRNRTYIDRTMSAGDTYRVPNMVGLRLSAPDAGAVEVILDGASVGFAGQDGVIARGLSLNPQNIIDRQTRG